MAPTEAVDGSSNLTAVGKEIRSHFDSDGDFLHFLAGLLNSSEVERWALNNPQERFQIPRYFDTGFALRVASQEASQGAVWDRLGSKKRAHLDLAVELFYQNAKAKHQIGIEERVLEALERHSSRKKRRRTAAKIS